MDTGIKIGNTINKDDIHILTTCIMEIFESGHEHHMSQETIRLGLRTLAGSVEVKNVNVENCVFTDRPKTISVDDEHIEDPYPDTPSYSQWCLPE